MPYTGHDPLQYRRNAISISVGIFDERARFGINQDAEGMQGSEAGTKSRMMSVSNDADDPRLRKILSRFSVGKEDDENGNGCRLTHAQINAFKEVFDLFDSNGGGTIDADELDLALQSVGIQLSRDDLVGVLDTMDKDGNGEIDFYEFLNLMTNTEKFLESFESKEDGSSLEKENHRREILLFEALTQFMKNSALHSMEEIVGYFHSKSKRSQAPHVVSHYAAGARLIGLTEKQLQKHMENIRASNANSNSPYAQPLYNLNPSSGKKRARKAAPSLPNCLRAKKGKIKLRFTMDIASRSSESEGKRDIRVRGVKSASDLTGPSHDTANKKPRQLHVKRNGWVTQKAKPLSVHLPTVHMKPRKHWSEKKGILTFDDLPEIRKKVEKSKDSYYKQVQMKKEAEAKNHWESLRTDYITSDVLKTRFRKVFRAYTASR